MSKLFLHVVIDVRPGKLDEFVTVLKDQAEIVRGEKGCELIEISKDTDSSQTINVWEIWADRLLWDAHMENEASKKWQEIAKDFIFGEKISVHQGL